MVEDLEHFFQSREVSEDDTIKLFLHCSTDEVPLQFDCDLMQVVNTEIFSLFFTGNNRQLIFISA